MTKVEVPKEGRAPECTDDEVEAWTGKRPTNPRVYGLTGLRKLAAIDAFHLAGDLVDLQRMKVRGKHWVNRVRHTKVRLKEAVMRIGGK